MTDLESTLSVALRDAAAGAPRAVDLAGRARGRLRRRRRTSAAIVAAALVVVAIPVGVQVARQSAGPDAATVPTEWRTESYRDLTLQVPADWGYEGGPDWCVDGPTLADADPAVTRGEGFQADLACSPRLGYGVIFGDLRVESAERPRGVPDGAVVDVVGTTRGHAWIVAESEEQLEQIRSTFSVIDEVDANGCPPVVDPDGTGAGDRVSVCRYDSGQLEQSELLSAANSAALRDAVADAPFGGAVDPACAPYSYAQPIITLRSEGFAANVLPALGCGGVASAFMDGSTERLVTEDVLYWALSPGATVGVTSHLPLPEQLRGLD